MKVQSERLPGSLARLEIEVESEQVDREVERAYKRLANRVLIPGFRRGKAPRVLVERTLGPEYLLQEATQEIVPRAIADALESENLSPAGEPESYNQLETEPFRFEVTVPLTPTVTLGDYASVTAERQPVEVADAEVREVIDRLVERETAWETPDPPRPARMGDQLVVDVQDFVEDEPLGEPQEDLTVVLGEGPLMPELDEQLVGVEEGAELDLSATLPDDHREEELRGKPARFHVGVKSIREAHRPELDDEFAKRVGEGVETLDELRRRVRENLEARKASEERDRLLNAVMDQIVERSEVDLPDVLVEREVDHRIEHLAEELRRSGIDMETFFAITNRSREDVRNEYRQPARDRLVRGLVMNEVGKAENIAVEAAEIDAEIRRITSDIADEELANATQLLQNAQWRDRIRADLYDRKLLNRVVEIATGEPLDAPITESEDAPMQQSDLEIMDAAREVEADRLLMEEPAVEAAAPPAPQDAPVEQPS